MILAVDVQYGTQGAVVAGVTFEEWDADSSSGEYITNVDQVQDYEPGKFYKRELPCILSLIKEHKLYPDVIVVDGYVYLDGKEKPGLGKYLHDAMNNQIEVVGVAKKAFPTIPKCHEIYRGTSKKPLYITTTSNDLENSKRRIAHMSGQNRLPILLKRADQLCREKARQSN